MKTTAYAMQRKRTTIGAAAQIIAALTGGGRGATTPEWSKPERNKEAVRRLIEEVWNCGELSVADEIVATDYVRHDTGDALPANGPEGIKHIVAMMRAMVPNLKIELEALVAEGDIVVGRYVTVGTDTRGYLGMAPTGRTLRTLAIQMFRFANGKIVESWTVRDDLGMLRRLGHLSRLMRNQ